MGASVGSLPSLFAVRGRCDNNRMDALLLRAAVAELMGRSLKRERGE